MPRGTGVPRRRGSGGAGQCRNSGKDSFRGFCTLPRETTRGKVRNPRKNRGPLTKPAEECRPSDKTRGRVPAQRQNPRKSDSQGPALLRAAAPLAKPPAETQGRSPSVGFAPFPAKQHAERSETRGRTATLCQEPAEETLPLLSVRQRAPTSRSGRATRTHPRPATRPLGSRAAARANPPGALGLWR